MAYRTTSPRGLARSLRLNPTAKQRSKMTLLSQEGRVTFAGPRASDGMIVAVCGRAGELEARYITRSGRVLSRAEVGNPDPREFDVLPA